MRITIIGSRGIPAKYGGFEIFTEIFSKKLVENGFNVLVACEFSVNAQKKYKKINLIYFPTSPPSSYFMRKIYEFFNDVYFMVKTAKKSDIQYILGMTSGSLLFIPKIINPKLKLLINIDGVEWKRKKFSFFERSFLLFNTLLGMVLTDIIVIDSKEMKRYIPKILTSKIKYISYGVSIPEEIPWNPNILKEQNLDEQIIRNNDFFLIVARLEPENNIDVIVEGYCKSKTKKPLIVIGNFTSQKYKEKIVNRCVKSHNIYFINGIYRNDQLLNMFRQHCYVYFHGHSVGGTNPSLLDAMAMKNIIIAHNNEFNKEVCGEHALYFHNSADIRIIIEMIEEKYTDFREWKNLGYSHVIKNYSWSDVIEKYKSLFFKLWNSN